MPIEAARVRPIAAALLVLVVAGCPAPERQGPARRTVDKQSLYGDAGLVPTREGERVRRELALAGELEKAVEQLALADVHVDVELNEPPGVIVIAQADPQADTAQLEATITAFAQVIVPGAATVHVQLRQAETGGDSPAPAPDLGRAWAIALACFGLGLSLGMTVERLLARRMAQRAR
jgi:hypothetical protein